MRLSAPQVGVLAFLLAIAAGAVLLSLPASSASGLSLAIVDAVFMAVSAVCITGLSVIEPGSDLSLFGQVVLLLLIKAGGFGVVTLGVLIALATGRRVGVRARLGSSLAHSPMQVGGVVRLLRNVFLFITAMELAATVLLFIRFRGFEMENPAYMALFHAVSGFNHAGLSLFPGSLQRFGGDPVILLSLAALIVLSGLGFVVIFELLGRLRAPRLRQPLTLHSRLVLLMSLGLVVFGTVSFAILEWSNPATLEGLSAGEKLTASVFQGVSPRSAGFSTVDTGSLRSGTQLIVMLLMFVGGSPGSVAGGIKTTTLAVVLFSIWQLARGYRELHVFGRRIETALIMKAAAICTLGILVIGGAATLLTVTDPGLDTTALVFEAVSAAGTSGLSLGITADLSVLGKLLIAALMFMGRIGLLTFLLAFVQKREQSMVRYPREDVLIG